MKKAISTLCVITIILGIFVVIGYAGLAAGFIGGGIWSINNIDQVYKNLIESLKPGQAIPTKEEVHQACNMMIVYGSIFGVLLVTSVVGMSLTMDLRKANLLNKDKKDIKVRAIIAVVIGLVSYIFPFIVGLLTLVKKESDK